MVLGIIGIFRRSCLSSPTSFLLCSGMKGNAFTSASHLSRSFSFHLIRPSVRCMSNASSRAAHDLKKGSGLFKWTVGGTLLGLSGYALYFYFGPGSSEHAIAKHNEKVAGRGPIGRVSPLKPKSSDVSDDGTFGATSHGESTPVLSRKDQAAHNKLMSFLRSRSQNVDLNAFGVSSIHSCWINANPILEDRHSERAIDNVGVLVGMFDGHSGFQASDVLSNFLPNYINNRLKVSGSNEATFLDMNNAQAVSTALQEAFEAFDNDFTSVVPKLALKENDMELMDAFVKPAFAGAVAVVALLDANNIYVANTGDCRAVLGIKREASSSNEIKYGALPLSNDQTGDTPSEIARIRREHPDEPKCVYKGRILGRLQPSRAFGDSKFKWAAESIRKVPNTRVPSHSLTPPYVTARPEVLHTRRNQSHRFIILATDGIWDVVDNTQAVNVVGEALEKGQTADSAAATLTMFAMEEYSREGHFSSLDELMNIPVGKARNHRDDITCTVVVFDDAQTATTSSIIPQPKDEELPQVFDSVKAEHIARKEGKVPPPPHHGQQHSAHPPRAH
eukprot:m.136980 g.136980  ORF g.136980 m.136980 type:complete len:561 (+) comp11117_c0_seq1:42-1724(+)